MVRTKNVNNSEMKMKQKMTKNKSKAVGLEGAKVSKDKGKDAPALKLAKPRRSRSGKAAIREAKRLQQKTDFLMARKPFIGLVRQVASDMSLDDDLRFQKKGLLALQTAAEVFLHDLFRETFAAMVHAKRKTILSKDLRYATRVLTETSDAIGDSFDIVRSKKVSKETIKPAAGVKKVLVLADVEGGGGGEAKAQAVGVTV